MGTPRPTATPAAPGEASPVAGPAAGTGRRVVAETLAASAGFAVLFVAGYFGIPQLHDPAGGISLATGLDARIPYVPAFAYVYALGYVQVFAPALLVPDHDLFVRAAAGLATILVASFVCFALVPVRVPYPPLTGAPGEWILRRTWVLGAGDHGYDAFPSLHVSLSIFAALSIHHAHPSWRVRVPLWALTAAIAASTVLTKRHFVADVPAGALLGWAVHRPLMTDRVRAWRAARTAAVALVVLCLAGASAAPALAGDALATAGGVADGAAVDVFPAEDGGTNEGDGAGASPGIPASRYFEPVEVPGVGLDERPGRCEGGAWVEVPWQRLEGDRALVLARDLGAPGERCPSAVPAAHRAHREYRLRDPLTGEVASIHFRPIEGESDASPGEVRASADGATLAGACWGADFDPADPALFATLRVPPSCGGSGENVLAVLRSTSLATVLGVDVEQDRSDMESRLLEQRAGPLRVARVIGHRVHLPLGAASAETVQESHFYPYHYVYPVALELPAVLDWVLGSLAIEFSTDWNEALGEARVVHGAGPAVAMDGATAAAERTLDGAPFAGWRLDAPAARFLNLLVLGPDAPFEARLRYVDGPDGAGGVGGSEAGDGDDEPGENGDVAPGGSTGATASVRRLGFVLRNDDGIGEGAWTAVSTTIFPRPGDDRGPAEFQRLLEHPLEGAWVEAPPGPPSGEGPGAGEGSDAVTRADVVPMRSSVGSAAASGAGSGAGSGARPSTASGSTAPGLER